MKQVENVSKLIFLNLSAFACISLLAFAAATTAFNGLSQYFVYSGSLTKSDADVEKAISVDSTNPNAFELRGALFLNSGNYLDAIDNFTTSLKLSPNNYLSWLRLGYCRSKVNDFEAAKDAYGNSISLAPNYSKPKRYMGSLLHQLGETEKAFVYLSEAAAIDDALLPETLDLARKTFQDDPVAIENAVQLSSKEAKKSLALYFIKHRLMSERVRSYMLDPLLESNVKEEFIDGLIETKDFKVAFAIWLSDKTMASSNTDNFFVNGDFETEIDPDESQFGWVLHEKLQNVVVNADTTVYFSNKVSLQFIFDGNSDPGMEIISQLALLKPRSSHALQFSAQGKDIVTGGLPVITIYDARTGNLIAESQPISNGNWNKYTVNFSAKEDTDAVIIRFQRKKCKTSQCPIFGQVWLDNFVLN
jgi:tetratricopeptide (TPR) repeat protein